MWEYQNTDELYHHGVLGMKWGVRRRSKSNNTSYKRSKKRTMSQDAREAKAIKKKKLYQMSNAELRKLNERKNLEQNYKRLNPGVVKKGALAVGAVGAGLGTIAGISKNGPKVYKIGKSVVNSVGYQAWLLAHR